MGGFPFEIDEKAHTPIWVQIRNRIVHLIRSGYYKTGDRLPSVRELAVILNINFNTVSKAYQDLERDGLIVTRRGLGTFVAATAESAEPFGRSPIDPLICELVEAAETHGILADELLYRINEILAERGGERG